MLALKGHTNYYIDNEQIAVVYSFSQEGMQVYSCKSEVLHDYMSIYDIKPLTSSVTCSLLNKYKDNRIPIINIELVRGCNHACKHCYHSENSSISLLSVNSFNAILQKIKKVYKSFHLRLSGGEPSLHPQIVPICENIMKCVQFPIHAIITNGTMPNKVFHKLLATGIQMQVSMYGFEYDSYKTFSGGNFSAYSNILNNLNSVTEKERQQIELVYYYSSITKNDILKFEDFVVNNGFHYRYSRIMQLGRATKNIRELGLEEDDAFVIKSKTFDIPVFRENICENNRINICIDGSVTPCPFWGSNSKYVMGNIMSDDLDDIINCKKFVSYRSESVENIYGCKTCPMRYLCTGGCRAVVESSCNNTFYKSVYCNIEKLKHELDGKMHLIQMPYPGRFIII